MEETLLSLNLTALFIIIGIVIPIYMLMTRNSIFSWFDPLVTYILFNSISTGLVIYLYFEEQNIRFFYFATYMISTISFIAGLALGNYSFKKEKIQKLIKINTNAYSYSRYSELMTYYLCVSIFILVFSNIILFIVKGTIPILSSNPSEAKVLLYTGGFGIVRRINFIMTSVVLAIIFIKMFNPVTKPSKRNKRNLIICFFITAAIIISGGSKSALLEILTSFFPIYLINLIFSKKQGLSISSGLSIKNIDVIKKYSKYAIIAGVFYMIIVVKKTVTSDASDTTESDSILARFIASGDTFYFFYVYDIYSSFHESAISYLVHLGNPITSSLRITEYEFPVGAYILNYSVGLELSAFGPNAQHAIEGLIYFGKYLFFLFSISIGYIISWSRTSLLVRMLSNPSQLNLFIYCVVASKVVVIATESGLFFLQLVDFMLFGIPVFILSLVLKQIIGKKARIITDLN